MAGEWIFHSPVFCYTGWVHLILGGVHFFVGGVQKILKWGALKIGWGATDFHKYPVKC